MRSLEGEFHRFLAQMHYPGFLDEGSVDYPKHLVYSTIHFHPLPYLGGMVQKDCAMCASLQCSVVGQYNSDEIYHFSLSLFANITIISCLSPKANNMSPKANNIGLSLFGVKLVKGSLLATLFRFFIT